MTINKPITRGIFCYEISNRFRACVLVKGEVKACYVASSCRLSNFLCLGKREVLLLPTSEKAKRAEFILFAARYKRGYVLLNLAMANYAIADQLHRRFFSFLNTRKNIKCEKIIEGYRADIYIADTKTIIEIKTILSEKAISLFPSIYSERSLKQLAKIDELLTLGYQVLYLFVSLASPVNCIKIDSTTTFYTKFKICVDKGLKYKACYLKTTEKIIEVDRMLPVVL